MHWHLQKTVKAKRNIACVCKNLKKKLFIEVQIDVVIFHLNKLQTNADIFSLHLESSSYLFRDFPTQKFKF